MPLFERLSKIVLFPSTNLSLSGHCYFLMSRFHYYPLLWIWRILKTYPFDSRIYKMKSFWWKWWFFLFLVTDGRFVFPCLKFWQPVNIFCQCSYILMFIENKVYFKWNANYVLIDSINFHIFSVLANISANIVLSRSETNMVCFPGLSICLSSHGFCSIKVATGIWWIDTIIFTVICSSLHHRVSYFKLFNSGPNLTLFEIKILAPDFFLLCPCLVYFCSVFQLLPFSVHFIYNFCI